MMRKRCRILPRDEEDYAEEGDDGGVDEDAAEEEGPVPQEEL